MPPARVDQEESAAETEDKWLVMEKASHGMLSTGEGRDGQSVLPELSVIGLGPHMVQQRSSPALLGGVSFKDNCRKV